MTALPLLKDDETPPVEAADLASLPLEELEALFRTLGEPLFRAAQVFRWLHDRGAQTFAEMTDVPKALRASLDGAVGLRPLAIELVQASHDGTRKYRLRTHDGHVVEAVYIPSVAGPGHNALCVSSQVGCAMGCRFCATAAMGLVRNLSAGEIVSQLHAVRRDLAAASLIPAVPLSADTSPGRITNLVFMGMGEPLHNYEAVRTAITLLTSPEGPAMSPRRITVSTSGLVPALARLCTETDVHVAISLNGSNDAVRSVVMPVNKKWDIAALLSACRLVPVDRRRRLTFEYVLLEGVNDAPEHAREVAQHLQGFAAKVNLIPFNAHPLSPYRRPSGNAVRLFQQVLTERGIQALVRQTRGDDIDAACGMLGADVLLRARSDEARVS